MIRFGKLSDLLYGATLIAIALVGFWLTSDLRLGTAVRMGPGYFPALLCWMLLAVGSFVAARSFVSGYETLEPWALRPLLCIFVAIAFFALSVERLGLPLAIAGVVLLSSLGDPQARRWEAIALAVGLAVVCSLVFVTALGLTIPLSPFARD